MAGIFSGVSTYLIIGMVLIGLSMGGHLRHCPNDSLDAKQLAIGVMIWPALLAAGFVAGKPKGDPKCDVNP